MHKIAKNIYNMINRIVRIKIGTATGFSICASSKVNFLGIRNRKNTLLRIGEESIIEGHIIFDKDGASVNIGNYTYIGKSNIVCAERIDIGDHVLIAWGCTIIDHNSHALSAPQRIRDVADWYIGEKDWSDVAKKRIKIENNVWIGFNSIILKGVHIGEGAVVGAGSVVTTDVESYTVVAGNPSKFIKKVESDEMVRM